MDKPINGDTPQKTNSLCWECARACGGANCPWADSLKPVRGWILASEKSSSAKGLTVLYCPMFFKGRSSDCMTAEQINSYHTNTNPKMSRIHTTFIKDIRGKKIIDKYYSCPVCKSRYDSKAPSCTNPECGVTFLYDKSTNYAMSFANLQVRSQFLKEQSLDFPNSRFKEE